LIEQCRAELAEARQHQAGSNYHQQHLQHRGVMGGAAPVPPLLVPLNAQNGHPPPVYMNGAPHEDIELQNAPSMNGSATAAAAV
jgi:hypothetical protein